MNTRLALLTASCHARMGWSCDTCSIKRIPIYKCYALESAYHFTAPYALRSRGTWRNLTVPRTVLATFARPSFLLLPDTYSLGYYLADISPCQFTNLPRWSAGVPVFIYLPSSFPWHVRLMYVLISWLVLLLPAAVIAAIITIVCVLRPQSLLTFLNAPLTLILALGVLAQLSFFGNRIRTFADVITLTHHMRRAVALCLFSLLSLIPVSTVRHHRFVFGFVFVLLTALSFASLSYLTFLHQAHQRSLALFEHFTHLVAEFSFDYTDPHNLLLALDSVDEYHPFYDYYPAQRDVSTALRAVLVAPARTPMDRAQRSTAARTILNSWTAPSAQVTTHDEVLRVIVGWKLATLILPGTDSSEWLDSMDTRVLKAADWLETHISSASCSHSRVDQVLHEALANAVAYAIIRKHSDPDYAPDYSIALRHLTSILDRSPSSTVVRDRTVNNLIDVILSAYWHPYSSRVRRWTAEERASILQYNLKLRDALAREPRPPWLITGAQLLATLAYDELLADDPQFDRVHNRLADSLRLCIAATAIDPDFVRRVELRNLPGLSWLFGNVDQLPPAVTVEEVPEIRAFVDAIANDPLSMHQSTNESGESK